MKLNPNCIRDILMTIEELDYDIDFNYDCDNNIYPRLQKYRHEEIVYHVFQCNSSGLFTTMVAPDNGAAIDVNGLSPLGHQFITSIRNDKKWKKVMPWIADKGIDAAIQLAAIYLALK